MGVGAANGGRAIAAAPSTSWPTSCCALRRQARSCPVVLVPANVETDEIRIQVFPVGLSELVIYVAVRRREGLLAWHRESVGHSVGGRHPAFAQSREKLQLTVSSSEGAGRIFPAWCIAA